MNIRDLTQLYEYNYWANNCVLTASANVDAAQFEAPASFPYGGLRTTLLHILDAESGWRVLFETGNDAEDLNPTDFPTLQSLQDRFRSEETAMRGYLGLLSDGDLTRRVKYTTNDGVLRDRMLWHCLMHVVTHGIQHRSEAAAILTDLGASPGGLDFVVFLTDMGIS